MWAAIASGKKTSSGAPKPQQVAPKQPQQVKKVEPQQDLSKQMNNLKVSEKKVQKKAPSSTPTKQELGDLSAACDKLWSLDLNRLEPEVDYDLEVQGGKKVYQKGDSAPEPFFKSVKDFVWKKPTFKAFYDLLDNYERETGVEETVTNEEKKETRDFLRAIMKTPCMIYCHKYLVNKKLADPNPDKFIMQLNSLWFALYKREKRNDSSGFEHVFVGEYRDGKVMGMHNWIQLFIEEKAGRLDYKGYIYPKRRGRGQNDPDDYEQLMTIQFAWEGDLKPISTSFIGVSPEFEIALYTLCFYAGKETNRVQLGPYETNIKCFSYGHGRNRRIGTSFPEAL